MDILQRPIRFTESLVITVIFTVLGFALGNYLKISIELFSELATILATTVGVIALLVAWFDVITRRKEQRRHVFSTINTQLELIKEWLEGSDHNYEGWTRSTEKEDLWQYTWAQPMNTVNTISTKPLDILWSLPGAIGLTPELNQNLSFLHQNLLNFNSRIRRLNSLTSSAGALFVQGLTGKLQGAVDKKFSAIQPPYITKEELIFCNLLVAENEALHYLCIGARNGNGLCGLYYRLQDML